MLHDKNANLRNRRRCARFRRGHYQTVAETFFLLQKEPLPEIGKRLFNRIIIVRRNGPLPAIRHAEVDKALPTTFDAAFVFPC